MAQFSSDLVRVCANEYFMRLNRADSYTLSWVKCGKVPYEAGGLAIIEVTLKDRGAATHSFPRILPSRP